MTNEEIVADIDEKIKALRDQIADLKSGIFSVGDGPNLVTGVVDSAHDRTQARIHWYERQIAMYEELRKKYAE